MRDYAVMLYESPLRTRLAYQFLSWGLPEIAWLLVAPDDRREMAERGNGP